MLSAVGPLAHLLHLNTEAIAKACAGVTGDAWFADDGFGHNMLWILGHLASTRHRMLSLAGLEPPTTLWEGYFMRGTAPDKLPRSLHPDSLLAAVAETDPRLLRRIPELTVDDLGKQLGRTLPDGSTTAGGALRFLIWHETYHVGQLGLLRRRLGLPGLA